MSGFWSIQGIENSHELWVDTDPSAPMLVPSRKTQDGRRQWLEPITGLLIWQLVLVHVEEITEANVEDTFVRIRMLELAQGPMLSVDGDPVFVELCDLRRRIGLRVGAGVSIGPLEETLFQALRSRAREDLKEAKIQPE
jgi:hypothetical protein